MHVAFHRTEHRPWPLPERAWTWRQSWCDLCFAHWPIESSSLRPLVPPELAIDEHEGQSWIGIVPFRMEGVARRPLPDMPGLSAFPEINVRIYVRHAEKAGVWFLSLDATNAPAVWAGRRWFDLPYHRAHMSVRDRNGRIHYESRRRAGAAAFVANYAPAGEPFEAELGSLEYFLTERYCLFAGGFDRMLSRTEVHHAPWPIQAAEMTIRENSMLEPLGLELPQSPPLVHFARRLDVVIWSPVAASEQPA